MDQDQDDRILAYMQDRLDPAARAEFEAEMAARPALAAEIAMLQGTVREFGRSELPAGSREAGWERLSAAIDAERMPRPANRNRALAALKVAGIVAATVAVWQFGVVPQLPQQEPGFITATETAEGPVLRAAFVPGATLGEVTQLLQEAGARVIDGPGALGLYTLGFADDAARDAAEARLAADPLVAAISRP
ncbi:hypothetical protein [Poseidonocella sp. HB161398]|uniref:hypothetical protein n=1 Tax=Poseidonocella sp. HB161398 TaxID=2320855 RepID=UPI0011092A4A|nr:hypothetical protein [Poseidonocella sp. HB161398]